MVKPGHSFLHAHENGGLWMDQYRRSPRDVHTTSTVIGRSVQDFPLLDRTRTTERRFNGRKRLYNPRYSPVYLQRILLVRPLIDRS